MIGSLRGVVLERTPPHSLLVEVSGVGYRCMVTTSTFAELEPTVPVFLHVHQHIREDAHTLFGFVSRDERDCFETLIGTHGVGPSMAMSILSVHSPRALVDVVASHDVPALTLVPGVGKKTAERLVIELKNKLMLADLQESVLHGMASSLGNVREALVGLGYGHDEIRDALRQLDGSLSAESLLRDALALLGARHA